MEREIKKIAIIGAGTMGSGIAFVFAQAGFETLLFDMFPAALERANESIDDMLEKAQARKLMDATKAEEVKSLIAYSSDFDSLYADLILEAIVEKTESKVELFRKLALQNDSECIFATNTSSIPITRIAAKVPNPERVVGMHFFNPAHIMKLVEVIAGEATDSKVVDLIFNLCKQIGKTPVLAKDAPGFIVNRVARHFYVEGLKVLEEQVATHDQIDRLVESCGFKMGPFKLMDLIGVDTNYSVTSSMFESFHFDAKFRPSRIQQKKVEAGFHGRKTKKGFYTYD